jgi:hypothetical protein
VNKNPSFAKLPIRCEFRSSGYTDEEIATLRFDLADVAVLQPRRQGIPEAGASYDISFIIQWAGLAVLSGVIGNAAYDLLKTLGERFNTFYHRKQKQAGLPPDIYFLEFRFDDLDLRLRGTDLDSEPDGNFLSFSTLTRLSDIISVVFSHLRTEPLSSAGVQAIDVYEPHPTLASDDKGSLLFTCPWRVEGVLQCHYSEYFPHERRLA